VLVCLQIYKFSLIFNTRRWNSTSQRQRGWLRPGLLWPWPSIFRSNQVIDRG